MRPADDYARALAALARCTAALAPVLERCEAGAADDDDWAAARAACALAAAAAARLPQKRRPRWVPRARRSRRPRARPSGAPAATPSRPFMTTRPTAKQSEADDDVLVDDAADDRRGAFHAAHCVLGLCGNQPVSPPLHGVQVSRQMAADSRAEAHLKKTHRCVAPVTRGGRGVVCIDGALCLSTRYAALPALRRRGRSGEAARASVDVESLLRRYPSIDRRGRRRGRVHPSPPAWARREPAPPAWALAAAASAPAWSTSPAVPRSAARSGAGLRRRRSPSGSTSNRCSQRPYHN